MTVSNSSLMIGTTTFDSASNGRSFSSSMDEAINGYFPWKLPSLYHRPTGIFAAVCQSGGVFTSPRPTSSTPGIVLACVRMNISTWEAAKAVDRARVSESILS